LVMVTEVMAFEQIYAINAGGDAHTDSDGIEYVKYDSPVRKEIYNHHFNMRNVPESDRNIYRSEAETSYSSIKFAIPIRNDGIYLLIAKFYNHYDGTCIQNMTLNDKIQLQKNVSLYNKCGDVHVICDEYFYFCVSDQILYYKNQTTLVQNEKIHIEFRPVNGWAHIAGMVLLKGTFGERQKLISSASNESIYFGPVHPKCSTTEIMLKKLEKFQEEQHQNSIKIQSSIEKMNENSFKNMTNLWTINKSTFEGIRAANDDTRIAINNLKKQQNESSNQWQISMENISKLSTIIQNLFETARTTNENSQVTVIREIQSQRSENFNRFVNMEQQISKIVERIVESSMENISNLSSVIQYSFKNAEETTGNNQVAIIYEIQSLHKNQSGNFERLENVEQKISESLQLLSVNIQSQKTENENRLDQLEQNTSSNLEQFSANNFKNILNLSSVIQILLKNSQEVNENYHVVILYEIESLHKNLSENFIRTEKNMKNILNLSTVIQSSLDTVRTTYENAQMTVLREILGQRSENFHRFVNMEQQISKIMDRLNENSENSLKNLTELHNRQITKIQAEMKSTKEGTKIMKQISIEKPFWLLHFEI
jgi:Malectin domain